MIRGVLVVSALKRIHLIEIFFYYYTFENNAISHLKNQKFSRPLVMNTFVIFHEKITNTILRKIVINGLLQYLFWFSV